MVQTTHPTESRPAVDLDSRYAIDKQTLALDALSKLTWHFAQKPDCHQLLDMFILTMAGQFSVSNAFVCVRNPKRHVEQTLYVGTGRYKAVTVFSTVSECETIAKHFLGRPEPCRPAELDWSGCDPEVQSLAESELSLMAPLVHGEKLVGVVGLGQKVTRKPFDVAETELLATLTNTIAPFIANSFLFMEIAHLNAWYLEILNSVKQGVYVFGSREGLKTLNTPGLNILRDFGVGGNEAGAGDLYGASMIEVFPEQSFPGWTRQFLHAYDEKQDRVIKNMVARTAAGERIYNVHVTALNQNDRFESGLVVTLDDITQQKESEERLFNLEKFADKGVMASSISHELNNFLGLILGGIELTQMALTKGNVEKAQSSLEKISANGGRMKRFTEGLMDYTRLETRKQRANLNTVITDVLSFLRVQNKFKAIRIVTELDPGLPELDIDADQIAQLLLNMLNNAAEAVNEARSTDGRIVLATSADQDYVNLSVRDNGIGIKPEVRDQLFRSHLTTKPTGHGYGLVTCAKIIEHHRALFEIESELGQGATFNFHFPIKP